MNFFVNVTPLRAGTAEPVGEVKKFVCPPDVEPDTLLSYVVQRLGEPITYAWTYSDRHPQVACGWIFPAGSYQGSASLPHADIELLAVPFTYDADGSPIQFFELQANERQDFESLVQSNAFDQVFRFTLPQREYGADEDATSEEAAPQPADRSDGKNEEQLDDGSATSSSPHT